MISVQQLVSHLSRRPHDDSVRKSADILAGCAYIYRQADGTVAFGPEVVDVWPGQTALSLGKTPSILFYDQR